MAPGAVEGRTGRRQAGAGGPAARPARIDRRSGQRRGAGLHQRRAGGDVRARQRRAGAPDPAGPAGGRQRRRRLSRPAAGRIEGGAYIKVPAARHHRSGPNRRRCWRTWRPSRWCSSAAPSSRSPACRIGCGASPARRSPPSSTGRFPAWPAAPVARPSAPSARAGGRVCGRAIPAAPLRGVVRLLRQGPAKAVLRPRRAGGVAGRRGHREAPTRRTWRR